MKVSKGFLWSRAEGRLETMSLGKQSLGGSECSKYLASGRNFTAELPRFRLAETLSRPFRLVIEAARCHRDDKSSELNSADAARNGALGRTPYRELLSSISNEMPRSS